MSPEEHIRKAERILRTVDKCTDSDAMIIVEGGMLAINHCVNAALHILGLRAADNDIIHSDYMSVAEMTRLRILAGDVLDCLERVEDMRAPYVRGCAPNKESAARQARIDIRAAIDHVGKLKPLDLPMVDYKP